MRLSLIIVFLLFVRIACSQQKTEYEQLWINEDSTQIIEIYREESLFFGRITSFIPSDLYVYDSENKNDSLKNRKLEGIVFLTDFELQEDGKLKNGKIYNFKNGNTYNGKMQIKDGEIVLTGYYGILFFLGKSQRWQPYLND